MPFEYEMLLQYSPETGVGDWFLFKDHIVISLYGSKVQPYKLPIYILPCIFALEYARQRLSSYILHFASRKKKKTFVLMDKCSLFWSKVRLPLKLLIRCCIHMDLKW